jgi:hypothetical protein
MLDIYRLRIMQKAYIITVNSGKRSAIARFCGILVVIIDLTFIYRADAHADSRHRMKDEN